MSGAQVLRMPGADEPTGAEVAVIDSSPSWAEQVGVALEFLRRRALGQYEIDEFGYDAWVLAYDLDTVRAISDKFPFEREVDGRHSYVTFVTDADVLDELAALAKDAGPDEKIKRGKGVIYWQVPNKGTLDTTIGKTMGKKRYKSSTTTRNLRTIDKVLK